MSGPDLTSDLDVMAATIWAEARGEPVEGRHAVAAVIMNRTAYASRKHYPEFGDGYVRTACLAPWQFSCWNEDDPNRAKMMVLDFDKSDAELTTFLNLAHDALNGSILDPTGGCFFYKTTVLPWPREWGKQVEADVVIGRQSFYKLGLKLPAKYGPLSAATPDIAPQEVDADPPLSFWQRLKACFA